MSESSSNDQNKRVRSLYQSPHEPDPLPHAGKLGLLIFLASLSMLFLASMVGYLLVRFRAEQWPPPGLPSLPSGLWVSTLIIVASSVTMHLAMKSIKRNQTEQLYRYMAATSVLGILFLAAQLWNWWGLMAMDVLPQSQNLYSFTFYMLTGLHAAHVLGGLVSLGMVTIKSYYQRYSAQDYLGVENCALYWHFLDGVWLVIYFVLLLAG